MATDFASMEYDPVTGQTKQKKTLPYLNENETNQGRLPYTGNDLAAGNANVMATAQQTAVAPQQSQEVQDQTTKMTQKLMTDPNAGRDWSSYNAGQMSAFDADRASSVKAFKEQNAGMGGSGKVQDNLIELALQQNTDRGLLENELEQQAYEQQQQNYLTALGQGREQGSYLDTSQENYINNLLNVRGAYEGEAERTTASQEKANDRVWQSGERMDTQSFAASQANLDRMADTAKQTNDTALTKWVENRRSDLILKTQTQDMVHDEKMTYLTDQLSSAEADKDVGRQQQIMRYAAGITLEEMEKNHGYDVALERINGDITQAISDGDHVHAEALQSAELEYRVSRDVQEFANQKSRLDLEKIGVDMTVVDDQYNKILNTYGEVAANEYIAATLSAHGVDTSIYQIADKQDAAIRALADEAELMKTQFLFTHPEYVDLYGKMSSEGLSAYNEYFNETMYGELSENKKEERRLAGYLGKQDLPFATEGDMYNLPDGYNNPNGTKVPPGEYAVTTKKSWTGFKYFGNQREVTKTYLVDQNGKEYELSTEKSGRQGNIISGLWSEE